MDGPQGSEEPATQSAEPRESHSHVAVYIPTHAARHDPSAGPGHLSLLAAEPAAGEGYEASCVGGTSPTWNETVFTVPSAHRMPLGGAGREESDSGEGCVDHEGSDTLKGPGRPAQDEVNEWMQRHSTKYRIPGVLALALLMCLGVVMVGIVGFLPMYLVGFNSISNTARGVQLEAVRGIVTTANTSVTQLPSLLHTIMSNYMASSQSKDEWFPENKSTLMFSLLNVLANTPSKNQMVYLYIISVGGGWMTMTSSIFGSSSTRCRGGPCWGGTFVIDNQSAPMYEVDHVLNTYTVQPPAALTAYNFSINASIMREESPYQNIVRPWHEAVKRGEVFPKRWNTRELAFSGQYFDYIIPMCHSKKHGFAEAAFTSGGMLPPSSSVQMLTMRQNGRAMLVDAEMEYVLENTWNESTLSRLPGPAAPHYSILYIQNITDPIMRSAIREVTTHGGFAKFMSGKSHAELRFEGERYRGTMTIARLSDEYGLNVFVCMAFIEQDFLGEATKTRNIVVSVIAILVFVVAVMSFVAFYILIQPLQQLTRALKKTSALQLPVHDVPWVTSIIREINDIQHTHNLLQQQLLLMKSYVPQAILSNIEQEEYSANPSNATQLSARPPPPGQIHPATSPTEVGRHRVCFREYNKNDTSTTSQAMGAETKTIIPPTSGHANLFREPLNSFMSTYCTVMTIDSVWEPSQPATALTEFFEAIVACVAEHNGCIEALRPDRTVVSFGAHAPLPMHASKACACALAIYARLSQHKRDGVVMTIDSSEFLVGTCGAHARNARVLFGILHFHAVSRVLRRISCHVGAMMGTATHLQELQLYPIDCVQVPQSVVPTVVYELRTTPSGDREARQRARLTYNHFRHGLSAMRQGNYTLARSHFRQLDPSDGQAARLLAICERCIDTDSAQPYVVRIGETYEVRTTGSTPAAGACTSLATLSMTAPTEHNTIMRRSSSVGTGEFHSGLQHRVTAATDQAEHEASVGAGASRREGGAAEEGTVVGLPASAPQPPETLFDPEYSPLFELMAPSESSDSVSVHDGDDSGVPLVLTDNNGKRWSRSLRNFSEGAFSVVYLGMSESGEQVALKCIPRRRRDISQASLAAELEMASRLRHANIVRYVSYCETPGHLTLVMEYVPGGSLAGVIGSFGRLTATAARRFVTDVLRGLHYLHSRGIVHCDVKPHNVLLGMDGVCKLSDFGSTVSEAADAARVGTDDVVLRGTALYMAPEVARGERCTSQSDIYSLGVSLLEMLTGQPPWGWTAAAVAAAAAGSEDVGGSAEQLHLLMRRDVMFARALGRGEVAPVVPDTLSPDVAGFVRACCQEDPARRPTALQLQSFPFVL